MRLNKWIGVLTMALAVGDVVTSAYQRIDVPRIKPQNKQQQLAPVEFVTPEELKTKIAKNEPVEIVDVRGASAYAQSDRKIIGSVHMKVRRVAARLKKVPRDKEVVTYCACPADEAAVIAARSLLANGFKRVRVLKGGWNAWLQIGGQVQPKPKTL
ncbi:MAG TPA: rhodanese-like domain-containing protein [Blastocatellia bacterium]|nr:rhodanese-like domain-containing protein [Blastocatellia bacterium]